MEEVGFSETNGPTRHKWKVSGSDKWALKDALLCSVMQFNRNFTMEILYKKNTKIIMYEESPHKVCVHVHVWPQRSDLP